MNTQRRIEALQSLVVHLQKIEEGVNKVADGTAYGVNSRISRINDALMEARKQAEAATNLLRVARKFTINS